MPFIKEKLFIKEKDLINDSFSLGVEIFNSDFRPSFIVGLWRGGSSVGIYVQECLQHLGVETDHIAVRTSYSGLPGYQEMVEDPTNNIRVHGTQYLLESLNYEDRLLLVDDVSSSGLTLDVVERRLQSRLKKNMPRDVRLATVWYKPKHNKTGKKPDFYVHETDDWLVLPYELQGLTPQEIRIHKPMVAKLSQDDP
ncbi:MAG: phosphoribosyltransferase family protein [Pseudomonadota bacterium]